MAEEKPRDKHKKKHQGQYINIKATLLFKLHIIAPAVFFVILASGYAFFIKPRIDFLNNKTPETDIVHWQAELDKKKSARDALQNDANRFEMLKDFNLDVLYAILPKKFDMIELMLEVEALVETGGFTLNDISVTEAPGGSIGVGAKSVALPPNVKKAIINLNVSGIHSYESLKTFLRRIEDHVRLFDVVSFPLITEVSSVSEDAAMEDGTESHNFLIQTYFLVN